MLRSFTTVALAALCGLAVPAVAHEGSADFESLIRRVTAPADGVRVQVLNGDDRLEIRNRSGKTLIVEGYEEEPYARLSPDGTVAVNERSSATYLNEDRQGETDVPDSADPRAAPRWRVISRTGRFEFHDHRFHWMAKGDPPVVRDKARRTKVFDWKVPLRIEGRPAAIEETLWWRGRDGATPAGAYVALGLIVLGAGAAVVVVRRRRRLAAGGGSGTDRDPGREAW